MKLLIAALLSLMATLSVQSAKADTLQTDAIARTGSRVVINAGNYMRPYWKAATVKSIFSDGRAAVRFKYQDDDTVVSLRGAGVGVQCLYNDQVCEGHAAAIGSRIGVIKEVFSNGYVAVRLQYQDEDMIVSLKEIGVQADCAVISCAIKLK